jgi:hypothetical protein
VPAAARLRLTEGIALAGSSVIAVTPIAPVAPLPEPHVANFGVRLTAGEDLSGLFNIPVNLFHDIVNIPYDLLEAPYSIQGMIPNFTVDGQHVPGSALAADGTIQQPSDVWPLYFGPFDNIDPDGHSTDPVFHGALNLLAGALDYTGSFYVSNPTNVFGWDTGNTFNLPALIDVLLPIKALGEPVGQNLNTIAEAEFPEASALNAYLFHDALGELKTLFTVPFSTLVNGYTLPPDGALNPTGAGNGPLGPPEEAGLPYHDLWSGEHVKVDSSLGFDDFVKSLMQDPNDNPIHPLDLSTLFPTYTHLQQAINVDFNPLEPGADSFIFQAAKDVFGLPALINGIFNGPNGIDPGGPDIIPESVTKTLGNALNEVIGPGSPLEQFLVNDIGEPFNAFINAFTDYPQPPALDDPLPVADLPADSTQAVDSPF